MSDPILQASGVWKVFGPKIPRAPDGSYLLDAGALRDKGLVVGVENATIAVERGEILVIMGLSGSGKSTLLRCLTGLYPATHGQIVLDGVDLSRASRDALVSLRRKKVGMVFQSFALLPHLSAVDNVAFPLRVVGVARPERQARARAALALVGLAGLEHRFPSQMSGGQQQRVGIARSLIADPVVWFLDEPFSALDPLIRRDMQDEFLRLQSQLHKTIVFVTHDLEEAVRLADRIAIMSDGRILQVGTPEEVVVHPATDYVRRFVSGISKSRVVRVGRIMGEAPAKPDPGAVIVPELATLDEIMGPVLQSDGALQVGDTQGRIVGSLTRSQIAAWL